VARQSSDESPADNGESSDTPSATQRVGTQRFDWARTFEELTAADRSSDLTPEELELLARAAMLLGYMTQSIDALTRSYQKRVEAGETLAAVRCAFWASFQLFNVGDFGQGGGWVGRATRLLEGTGEESAGHAYLLVGEAFRQVAVNGDYPAGRDAAARAAALARRTGEADVVPLALNVQGRALLRLGLISEGLAVLDEAMMEVVGGPIAAPAAGAVYCSVIDACDEVFDIRRAQEWTQALTIWCDQQSGMVTFTGQCLVRRAAIKQFHGQWQEALAEAELACQRFAIADTLAAGVGWYRLGELHRVQGDLDAADLAYRKSVEFGDDPQPGLGLLRLAQGKGPAAMAAIQRALAETTEAWQRARLLPAMVDTALATEQVPHARTAADELASIASKVDMPVLSAIANQALGRVSLAEGDARKALTLLRESQHTWRDLGAPYDEARTRTMIAACCRSIGDEDTANLEQEAARRVFATLGAAVDLLQLDGLTTAVPSHGLTAREMEVMTLLAAGHTNQEIATELFLAVKTIDRHVSNILTKLGVSSRTAATAYAFKHGLVQNS
jgi:DNA-binding NarL/FixJ family response regulator